MLMYPNGLGEKMLNTAFVTPVKKYIFFILLKTTFIIYVMI